MQKTDGFGSLISQMESLKISASKPVILEIEKSIISKAMQTILKDAVEVVERIESKSFVKFTIYDVYRLYQTMKQIIDSCDFETIRQSPNYLKIAKTYKERCQDICDVDKILQKKSLALFDREVLKQYLVVKSKERDFLYKELVIRKRELMENTLYKKMIKNGVDIEGIATDNRCDLQFLLHPRKELSPDDLSICLRAVVAVRPLFSTDAACTTEKMKSCLKAIVDLQHECTSPLRELDGVIDILRTKTVYDGRIACMDGKRDSLECGPSSDRVMFDFIMSMDFSATLKQLHVAVASFQKSFKTLDLAGKKLDVPLVCDRIRTLQEWLKKLEQFRLDFNSSMDVVKFKKVYSKTVGNKDLVKSERECNGLVVEPSEYQEIEGVASVWDDWVVRYVQELQHKKEKQRREVKPISSVSVASHDEEPNSYSYHDRVWRWFQKDRNPFAEDKKYTHIASDKVKNKIHLFHSFAVAADLIVLQEGIAEEVSESQSKKYVLPCEIETKEKLFRGFLGYCVDQITKKIWHRCFTQRSQGDLLDELFKNKFFDFDYPAIDSEESHLQFSLPETPYDCTINDGSFIDAQNSRKNVVVIEDPKNQATLRIIRAS